MTTNNKKILIIDDDPDFSESIATFLELHGYKVSRAVDGRSGIAMAAAERPDVILCDVMMKERTEGFFTIHQLRRTPGLEKTRMFVISSVYAAVPAFQVEPEKSWLAADDFIYKPIDPEQLLQRIEEAS